VVPSTQSGAAKIPATGASDAVFPMTIISVLAYIYFFRAKRPSHLAPSKSRTI
jgi:hypothetical protein